MVTLEMYVKALWSQLQMSGRNGACLSPVVRSDARYSVWLACWSFCRLVMGTRRPWIRESSLSHPSLLMHTVAKQVQTAFCCFQFTWHA